MKAISSNVEELYSHKNLIKEQRRIKIQRFKRNKSAVIGATLTLAIIIIGFIGTLFVKNDPLSVDTMNRLLPPSADYLFGTDNLGRDLFSRVVYGAQISITVGFFVTLISSVLGLIIGLYASYYRFLDNILMRICDSIMAFPSILIAIAIMAILGPDIKNIIICLSIVFTPYIARVVRSAALVVKEQTYIEAMKSIGAKNWRIIWLDIFPNTLSPLIVQSTFIFAESIIVEAALSFLGVGVPAPLPSWGTILFDGKMMIFSGWWMILFPGLFLIITVLGLNLFGDGIRDLLDPKSSQANKK